MHWIRCALLISLALVAGAQHTLPKGGVFAKDNLLAWCVVPFDAKQRGPAERAAMLERLGIRMFVYDWRAKDIPTFDEELDELNKHGIRLQGFWLASGLHPETDENVAAALGFLKRRQVKTQIWYYVSNAKEMQGMTQEQKVDVVAASVGYVAREARKFGGSVAIYNHGGWTGEPENQIAVIRKLGMDNVGIVYNFHHGREHMDRFAELFAKMKPYLMAVNLNGMKQDAPLILPLGEGDRELGMLRVLREGGYKGPVGILNHRAELDAEVGLRQNIEGLRKLVEKLGDRDALRTY